jgi:hypothetical protein
MRIRCTDGGRRREVVKHENNFPGIENLFGSHGFKGTYDLGVNIVDSGYVNFRNDDFPRLDLLVSRSPGKDFVNGMHGNHQEFTSPRAIFLL